MSKKAAFKFKRLRIPEGAVEVGPPLNGTLDRAIHDLGVPRNAKLVNYPGYGPGVDRLAWVPRGQGLAVFRGLELFIMVGYSRERTSGLDLLHVSVNYRYVQNERKEPTFSEMNALRDAFFPPDVDVIQVHPKHSKYINFAEHVYHLWQFPGDWDATGV